MGKLAKQEEINPTRTPRQPRTPRKTLEPREPRIPREPRTPRETLEPREPRIPREPRQSRQPRKPRTPREPRKPRAARTLCQPAAQPKAGQKKRSLLTRFPALQRLNIAIRASGANAIDWLNKKKILPVLKLFFPQGITCYDYFFFIPLGLIVTITMQLAEWFNPDADSAIFSTLLADHMPVLTINILFWLLFCVTIVQVGLKEGSSRLAKFSQFITVRVHQLTSPMLLILLGMALGLFALGYFAFHQPEKYYRYAFKWLSLLTIPYMLIVFSNLLLCASHSSFIEDFRSSIKTWCGRMLVVFAGLAIFIGGLIFLCRQPPSVTVKFSDEEFTQLKQQASTAGKKPEEYMKNLALPVAEQP